MLFLLVKSHNMLSFQYWDGILGLKYLYQQEDDSIDVLVLGSSHAFEDINTQVLYDEYGIASYVLAGSIQPFWNTYYYLEEALKTQAPKLVVLEGYAATQNFEYSDNSRIIKNNFGIKDWKTRIESIKISSPPDKVDDYLFGYRLWHSRYSELGWNDVSLHYKNPIYTYYDRPMLLYYKGFGANFAKTAFDEPQVDTFKGDQPIKKKEEIYYRKIIELCQKNNIPIVVVVSPYVVSEVEQKKFNYLNNISKEYHIDFINFNSTNYYNEIGLDFKTDMADSGHLNSSGSVKYTRVLGKIFYQMVELPDCRRNENYQTWKMNSKDIVERIRDNEIITTQTVADLINNYGSGEDLITYLYTISDIKRINKQTGIFSKFGITDGMLADGKLYKIDEKNVSVISGSNVNWKYTEKISEYTLQAEHSVLITEDKVDIRRILSCEGEQYIDDPQGCYILIYNQFTKDIVCVKQIRINGDEIVELVIK